MTDSEITATAPPAYGPAPMPMSAELIGFRDKASFDSFRGELRSRGLDSLEARLAYWSTEAGRWATGYRTAESFSDGVVLAHVEDGPLVQAEPMSEAAVERLVARAESLRPGCFRLPSVSGDELRQIRDCASFDPTLTATEALAVRTDHEDIAPMAPFGTKGRGLACEAEPTFGPRSLSGDQGKWCEPKETFQYFARKVSPGYRERVLNIFPAAAEDTEDGLFLRCLLDYLTFCPLMEEDGRIVVGKVVVSACRNASGNLNFNALDRLQFFEVAMGFPLAIKSHNRFLGLSRSVLPVWPKEFTAALAAERELAGGTRKRVYFDTGEPALRSKRSKRDQEQFLLRRQNQELLVHENDPRRPILALLNRQSRRALRQIVNRNLPATIQKIKAMPQSLSRDYNLDLIEALLDECSPCYGPVDKSPRLYCRGRNLNQLSREIREALLSGCWQLDLRAAQASIVAVLWDVPVLLDALAGDDFWGTFLAELGLERFQKDLIKKALYSLIYGMTSRNLRLFLSSPETPALPGRFMKHPMIAALISARDRRMAEVASLGGLETVYGKKIAFPSYPEIAPGTPVYMAEARSILSQEVQAIEQAILAPALIAANRKSGVHIVDYLFDGIVLSFEDGRPERSAAMLDSLATKIINGAAEMGYGVRVDKKRL